MAPIIVHKAPLIAGWMTHRQTGAWLKSRGWALARGKRFSSALKRSGHMRFQPILLGALGALALSACSQQEEIAAAPPPPPPGAVPGSVAADRDGDGIIDGYYTADGIYHPNYAPPPPPPPPAPSRLGERG
jgi:hypothetical protein